MGWDHLPSSNRRKLVLPDAPHERWCLYSWWCTLPHPSLQRTPGLGGDDGGLLQQANPSKTQVILILSTSSIYRRSNGGRCTIGIRASIVIRCHHLLHGRATNRSWSILHLHPDFVDCYHDDVRLFQNARGIVR